MERDACRLRKGLEPFLEELGVHLAELGLGECHLPDEIGPIRGVERHARQRLVHGNERVAVPVDAAAVAERARDRLADDVAGILGGVVEIDVQIALGPKRDVDQAMARQLLQHVVEEPDAGLDGHRRRCRRDRRCRGCASPWCCARRWPGAVGPWTRSILLLIAGISASGGGLVAREQPQRPARDRIPERSDTGPGACTARRRMGFPLAPLCVGGSIGIGTRASA